MTGWAGTTRAEIAAVVMVVPLMTLALAGSSRLARHTAPSDSGMHPHLRRFAAVLAEFCALVLPETAVMMSKAASGPALAISGFAAAALLVLSSQLDIPSAQRKRELNALVSDFSGRLKGCGSGADLPPSQCIVDCLPNKRHQQPASIAGSLAATEAP